MRILNRSLDNSEQQRLEFANVRTTTTATSDNLIDLAQPAEIQSGRIQAVGLSGSPTCQLAIRRFVTGAGATLIPLGAALACVAVGTSGPQTYTFSTTALNSGDTIVATHAGSNAGLDQLSVSLVLKATQEVKSWDF